MCLLLAKCFSNLFHFKGCWGSLKMDHKQIWLGTSDKTHFSSTENFLQVDWNALVVPCRSFSQSWQISVWDYRCACHLTLIYWAVFMPSDLSCCKLWVMDTPSYKLIGCSCFYPNVGDCESLWCTGILSFIYISPIAARVGCFTVARLYFALPSAWIFNLKYWPMLIKGHISWRQQCSIRERGSGVQQSCIHPGSVP